MSYQKLMKKTLSFDPSKVTSNKPKAKAIESFLGETMASVIVGFENTNLYGLARYSWKNNIFISKTVTRDEKLKDLYFNGDVKDQQLEQLATRELGKLLQGSISGFIVENKVLGLDEVCLSCYTESHIYYGDLAIQVIPHGPVACGRGCGIYLDK